MVTKVIHNAGVYPHPCSFNQLGVYVAVNFWFQLIL